MVRTKSTSTPQADDEAFAKRFRNLWGRPEMTPIEAAAFETRLEGRLRAGPRPIRPVPAFGGAVVVAAMLAVVWTGRGRQGQDDSHIPKIAEMQAATSTEGAAEENGATSDSERFWAVVEEDAETSLGKDLSGEYQVLAAWIFPASQGLDDVLEQ